MKKNKELIIDTKLSVANFIELTSAIVEAHFVEDSYMPQYGFVSTFGMFYQNCVKSSAYGELPSILTDFGVLENIMVDKEIYKAFTDELQKSKYDGVTFGAAYALAVETIEARNFSLQGVTETIKSLIEKFTNSLESVLSEENIGKIQELAKGITSLDKRDVAEKFTQSLKTE